MNKPSMVWARAAQEGEQLYKVAGVDDEGVFNIVFDIPTNEQTEYLLKTLRELLEKHDFDRGSQWWNDLVTLTDLARFWIARQYEAKAIGEQNRLEQEHDTDIALQANTLSTPYCVDRRVLSPQNPLWTSFATKLLGPDGICFSMNKGKVTWICDHTMKKTAAILNDYIKDGIDVLATLDFFREYDGTCDCKVLFDVTTNFYRSTNAAPCLAGAIQAAHPDEYCD